VEGADPAPRLVGGPLIICQGDMMFSSWLKTLGDALKGFFLYGFIEGIHAEKREMENLFLLGLFGPLIGFPGLFNYYHLRIFPYYMMHINRWKRRVLKERDFFDMVND